ncbi:flagellar calcium-binding protein-like [Symsagittifera roscoffensis]|uniref:flagellar calcium-binding protein-like n=1 Tax=Symsagittifera roscoffensis TaxID=84072 RepID=UPI00307C8C43
MPKASQAEVNNFKDKLPILLPPEKTEEAKETRRKLFSGWDPNGNRKLSLAEVDLGLRQMQLHKVFRKPVIIRAFNAAKGVSKTKGSSDDYIDRNEFRLLCSYLLRYFELYNMFDEIDESDDDRINYEEFEGALGLLKQWGMDIKNPRKVFDEIDANGGGFILFDEFSDWALKKKLSMEK